MKIKNDFNEAVHWRAFNERDTWYWVGLKQGFVEPGKTDEWVDDSFPRIKVEAKTGAIVFSRRVLAWPGRKFDMSDNLVIDRSGKLDVAKAEITKENQTAIRKTDVQFFDARKLPAPTERKLTFSIGNVFSSTGASEHLNQYETTWKASGSIAGGLGKGVNATLAGEFNDKVTEKLQNTFTRQVNNVWNQSITDTYLFTNGKIHSVQIDWQINLQEGFVSYFDKKVPYSVAAFAYAHLTTPDQFDKPEDMPASLLEKYKDLKNRQKL